MTYTDVYIGRLSEGPDPLDRSGGWDGNQPERISRDFPVGRRGGSEPFSAFHDRMKDGRIQGKQVDWGAWAAIMSKADIESFVFEIYGDNYDPDALPFQRSAYEDLMGVIKTLSNDQQYALVALES